MSDTTKAVDASMQAMSLDEAISLAQKNEPNFAAAVAANKTAALDRSIARSALLPGAVYHNQYVYTEPAHAPAASAADVLGNPRFIASNGVHEYVSQGVVTETFGLQGFNAFSHASAAAAVAEAQLEIARRGLFSTVAGLYYSSLAADRKVAIAKRAANEAADFTQNTRQRENAREVAHADVIKAELQQQQSDRSVADAVLDSEKARLSLAVLLFADPHTPFALTAAAAPAEMASREEIQAAAASNNPELKSAIASLHEASLDVVGAREAYLPNLNLNFTYGIDAPEFAVHAPDGTRNLGYAASATLDIPVWDWFATHNRVKQKVALRETARIQLSSIQKQLVAQLDEFYSEAKVAGDQIHSLQDSVETAREGLRLSRLRYTAGETNVLEVTDAQASLATQENALEDGIVRYQTALANLQLLTGQKLNGTK